jgi:hypothetical protein
MAANRRGAFWWWSVCWAALAAVTCAYQFFWSTFPVTGVDEPPGPTTVTVIGDYTAVLFALNALCSIPLFLIGLFRLRRMRRRMIAWVAAAIAGFVFEAMFVTGFGVPWVSPAYSGPAVVSWVYLAETAGYLIAAGVMTRATYVSHTKGFDGQQRALTDPSPSP